MKSPATFRRPAAPIRADPLRRAPGDGAGARARRDVQPGAIATAGTPARRYDDGWTGARLRCDDGDSAPTPRRDDGDHPARADDHRPQRVARHSVHAVDQSRTRAASTAASIATRGRRTRISTCRRGSISRRKLFAKPDAACSCLRAELAKRGLRLRSHRARHATPILTSRSSANGRSRAAVLEVLAAHEHPFTIVTKSALVERDIDLIAPMAREEHGARVLVGDDAGPGPRAHARAARGGARNAGCRRSRTLRDAGIPVGVLVAPVIPQLNDRDLEAILEAAAAHGATQRGLDHAAAAARGGAAVPRVARRRTTRCAPRT